MPEYLAPGVYVEETSYRTKSIEGVGTTTTAFVGPTRFGPVYDTPEILTSLADFELTYGDGEQLWLDGSPVDNYVWQAARAFFTEGGNKLYVKRIYANADEQHPDVDQQGVASVPTIESLIDIKARYPGAFGNFHVRLTFQLGQNVLAKGPDGPEVRGLSDYDLVLLTEATSPTTFAFGSARSQFDTVTSKQVWYFDLLTSPPGPLHLDDLVKVQVLTVTVSVSQNEPGAATTVWAGLPLDPRHQLGGAPDSLFAVFGPTSSTTKGMPITITTGTNTNVTGFEVLEAFFTESAALVAGSSPPIPDIETALQSAEPTTDELSLDLLLTGGTDGKLPPANFYEGVKADDDSKTGLVSLEDLDDVSIVAAPGSTHNYLVSQDAQDRAHAIINDVIAHAQKMRYRIAVIDAGNGMSVGQVHEMRAQFDSSWAAFYYPWIEILDPMTQTRRTSAAERGSSPGSMHGTTSTARSTRRRQTRSSTSRSASRRS